VFSDNGDSNRLRRKLARSPGFGSSKLTMLSFASPSVHATGATIE